VTARPKEARDDLPSRGLRLVEAIDLDAFRAAQPPALIQVLLAEALDLVRAGLRSVLEREDDIVVVGEGRSSENAIALATELRPDVLLMDVRLPGLDALAAARQLHANPQLPRPRVVMLAWAERAEDLLGALGSGIDGLVLLEAEPVDLVRAVRVVARGGAYLSPGATRWLLDELPHLPHARSEAFEDLTDRERDVVRLAARGLSNAEIADRLVISPATVKTHIGRAMTKLDIHDRAKLVALAHQSGFVKHDHAAAVDQNRVRTGGWGRRADDRSHDGQVRRVL
jgi:DNA-binding NarL/FixJ family response regulator